MALDNLKLAEVWCFSLVFPLERNGIVTTIADQEIVIECPSIDDYVPIAMVRYLVAGSRRARIHAELNKNKGANIVWMRQQTGAF
jgi:hypothetical protein